MRKIVILLVIIMHTAGCFSKETLKMNILIIRGTTASIATARTGVKALVMEHPPMLGGVIKAHGSSAIDGNAEFQPRPWNELSSVATSIEKSSHQKECSNTAKCQIKNTYSIGLNIELFCA